MIIFFLPLRRSCRTCWQDPGVWLCTREKGTTGLPQFLTVALSYIRRDLKSAGGVAVSVGNYSSSLPRVQEPVTCCVTGAEPTCRPSRAGLVRSNSSLVEHKIVLAVVTLDLCSRRQVMLQQVLPATCKILLPSSVTESRAGRWSGSFRSKVYSSRGDGVAGYGIRCLVFFRRRSWTIGAPGIDEAGTVRRAAA